MLRQALRDFVRIAFLEGAFEKLSDGQYRFGTGTVVEPRVVTAAEKCRIESELLVPRLLVTVASMAASLVAAFLFGWLVGAYLALGLLALLVLWTVVWSNRRLKKAPRDYGRSVREINARFYGASQEGGEGGEGGGDAGDGGGGH